MDATLIKELNVARQSRQAVAVVTDIASGSKRLIASGDLGSNGLGIDLEARFRSGKSGLVEINGAEAFIQVYVPSPRLVVIGAVHISQALVPMAKACDFDVTVIDPRTAFATPDRFAGTDLHAEWPQEVLKEVALDAYTALIAVTHDPKIDDIPLRAALDAGCFYVGALGSRKTHGKRLERLSSEGVDDDLLKRINAPIGLDIGAASPSEIAISIMAELIEALRKGSGA